MKKKKQEEEGNLGGAGYWNRSWFMGACKEHRGSFTIFQSLALR
jgi:hypothetical protein